MQRAKEVGALRHGGMVAGGKGDPAVDACGGGGIDGGTKGVHDVVPVKRPQTKRARERKA